MVKNFLCGRKVNPDITVYVATTNSQGEVNMSAQKLSRGVGCSSLCRCAAKAAEVTYNAKMMNIFIKRKKNVHYF